MSKKRLLLAAGLLCASANCFLAQEVALDVDTLLNRIAEFNAEVTAARSHYQAVRQGIAVARSARLPEVTAVVNLNYLGDGTVIDRDFAHTMRDKLPHFGNTLTVSLYQPLYQGGAIAAGIDMVRQETEIAAIGVEQQMDAVAIEAIRAYFNLIKMHNLRKVYQENISLTEHLIAQMTERYRLGTALHNDITRYELRLSTLNYDLQTIDNSISVLNRDLTSLLGYPEGCVVMPDTASAHRVPPPSCEADWLGLSTRESKELRAVVKSKELGMSALRLEKSTRLPHIGLVAGDELSGPVTFEIPAINKNYNAWYAGISIKYSLSPLWTANKREKRRRLEIAETEAQHTALGEALRRRVHSAYTAMEQARQMAETEEVNVRLANENYAVVCTRFDHDMALLTDMLDASTSKLDSEVRLVNARINLLLSYYQLKYISGTLNSNIR